MTNPESPESPQTPDSVPPAPETVDPTDADIAEPVDANDSESEPVELPSGNTLLYVDGNTVLETPNGSRYEAGSDVHDTVIALSNLYPDRF